MPHWATINHCKDSFTCCLRLLCQAVSEEECRARCSPCPQLGGALLWQTRQDSTGQGRTQISDRKQSAYRQVSYPRFSEWCFLSLPYLCIICSSFFSNVTLFLCNYTDSPRAWCFKTKLLMYCHKHFSDWLVATSLLKADCRYVFPESWSVATAPVGPSVLLTWAFLPPFSLPFSRKEQRRFLRLLL